MISVLCACGMNTVKKVEKAIDAIGEVSLDSEDAVQAAKALYLALDEKNQEKVSNIDKLEIAEKTLYDLKIVNVENLIDQIGSGSDISKEAIDAARAAYDALDAEMQNKVQNADDLTQAEEWYELLQHISDYEITNYQHLGTSKVSLFNETVERWYGVDDIAATAYICFLLEGNNEKSIDLDEISFNVYICICRADERVDIYSKYGKDKILGIQYWPSESKAQFGTIKTDLAPKDYADILTTAGIVDAGRAIPISSVSKILNAMS